MLDVVSALLYLYSTLLSVCVFVIQRTQLDNSCHVWPEKQNCESTQAGREVWLPTHYTHVAVHAHLTHCVLTDTFWSLRHKDCRYWIMRCDQFVVVSACHQCRGSSFLFVVYFLTSCTLQSLTGFPFQLLFFTLPVTSVPASSFSSSSFFCCFQCAPLPPPPLMSPHYIQGRVLSNIRYPGLQTDSLNTHTVSICNDTVAVKSKQEPNS